MLKRIIASTAAGGLGLVLFTASPAAGACSPGPSAGSETVAEYPGGEAYNSGAPGGTSGFIGLKGDRGYIEVGGDAMRGEGGVHGSTAAREADGDISNDGVCVNDVRVP